MTSERAATVLIGTSGFAYSHWRHPIYHGAPERRWLELYSALLPTVEINATFYRLPRPSAVRHWAEGTPPGFVVAVKVSRYLTHVRRLREVPAGMERLLALLAPLQEARKLGPLLWQLPPGFQRDQERLETVLRQLPPGRHAFEFRHPSWFCKPVYEALAAAGAALVVADDARRRYGVPEATADWHYLRFHYGARGRRGNYGPTELAAWARRIGQLARTGDVYAYFNNDWEGFAVRNALDLDRRVGRRPQEAAA
jgi:uncharacterized protein YecE (DUF72 family)